MLPERVISTREDDCTKLYYFISYIAGTIDFIYYLNTIGLLILILLISTAYSAHSNCKSHICTRSNFGVGIFSL